MFTPAMLQRLDAASQPRQASLLDRLRRRTLQFQEWQIRQCLGLWVSGLEPVLLFDHDTGQFLGLTAEGHAEPYVTP